MISAAGLFTNPSTFSPAKAAWLHEGEISCVYGFSLQGDGHIDHDKSAADLTGKGN